MGLTKTVICNLTHQHFTLKFKEAVKKVRQNTILSNTQERHTILIIIGAAINSYKTIEGAS